MARAKWKTTIGDDIELHTSEAKAYAAVIAARASYKATGTPTGITVWQAEGEKWRLFDDYDFAYES